MNDRLKSDELMIRYLLGELSAEEQTEVETSYFAEPEKFDQLQTVEHDLIEGYISGKLSTADRARFERHYLTSPVRRERVRFFNTLAKSVPLEAAQPLPAPVPVYLADSGTAGTTSWWQSLLSIFQGPRMVLAFSAMAVVLVLIGGGVWQLGEIGRLRGQLTQIESERLALQQREQELNQQIASQQGRNEQLTQELKGVQQKLQSLPSPSQSVPETKPAPALISFAWTLNGMRDATTDQNATRAMRIPPGTNTVQLVFNLSENRYSRYRLALQNLAGEQVWSHDNITIGGTKSEPSLTLKVPAKQFQPGTYALLLSGNNARGEWLDIGEYYIEVN